MNVFPLPCDACSSSSQLQDVRYLKPHVEEVWKEDMERAKWDTIQVQKK